MVYLLEGQEDSKYSKHCNRQLAVEPAPLKHGETLSFFITSLLIIAIIISVPSIPRGLRFLKSYNENSQLRREDGKRKQIRFKILSG